MCDVQMAKSKIYVRTKSNICTDAWQFTQIYTNASARTHTHEFLSSLESMKEKRRKKGTGARRAKKNFLIRIFNFYVNAKWMLRIHTDDDIPKSDEIYVNGLSFRREEKKNCEKLNLKLHQKIKTDNLSHCADAFTLILFENICHSLRNEKVCTNSVLHSHNAIEISGDSHPSFVHNIDVFLILIYIWLLLMTAQLHNDEVWTMHNARLN